MQAKKKVKEGKPTLVIAIAIIALAAIEVVALLKGINGALFTLIIAAIAGLGGYVLPSPIKK